MSKNVKSRLVRIGAISLCLCNFTTQSWASDDEEASWYDVELLVFAVRNGEARSAETWRNPEDMSINYPAEIIDLTDSNATMPSTLADTLPSDQTNYQSLPSKQRSFGFFKSQMRLNGNFRPLYHNKWRQNISSREQALPIVIQGGQQTGDYFELEGNIKLSIKRYLHIDTDLWLMSYTQSTEGANDANDGSIEPGFITSNAPSPAQSPQAYIASRIVNLKQTRKMRSDELHYLDHPLMGVVVRLTPYKAEEKATRDQEVKRSEPPKEIDG